MEIHYTKFHILVQRTYSTTDPSAATAVAPNPCSPCQESKKKQP